MELIHVLKPVAILLMAVGSYLLVVRKGARRFGAIMLAAGFMLAGYQTDHLNQKARQLGFVSHQEQQEAQDAGIENARDWTSNRDEIRSRKAAEITAARHAKIADTARAAGFDDVAKYEQAQKLGIESSSTYERHLAVEAFFKKPAKQVAFENIIKDSRRAYHDAANELARGGTRAQRKLKICRHIASRRVKGWVGTLTQLTTNSDGKGVITVQIGDDVYMKTWNNALSDLAHRTLIDPTSKVFQPLANLAIGKRVKFSGRLFASKTDCIHEASLTLRGAMTAPEFIVRLSSVKTPR